MSELGLIDFHERCDGSDCFYISYIGDPASGARDEDPRVDAFSREQARWGSGTQHVLNLPLDHRNNRRASVRYEGGKREGACVSGMPRLIYDEANSVCSASVSWSTPLNGGS